MAKETASTPSPDEVAGRACFTYVNQGSRDGPEQGLLTENSQGIGTVTRKMVRERAVELAVTNGRSAQQVSKSDWDQARQELTGDPGMDPKEAVLDSAPESERWDSAPGSTGHLVPASPSEDEDDEGRSDHERLVDEGIAAAELDQSLQASKAATEKDK